MIRRNTYLRVLSLYHCIWIKLEGKEEVTVVREGGLEPPSPKAPDPKSGASAISPLSPENRRKRKKKWWTVRDSNPQPPD
jgi:hypothetical protein